MAKIKNTTKKTNSDEDVEKKETLVHYRWEFKLVKPLWKTVWNFLEKQKKKKKERKKERKNCRMIQQLHSWIYVEIK